MKHLESTCQILFNFSLALLITPYHMDLSHDLKSAVAINQNEIFLYVEFCCILSSIRSSSSMTLRAQTDWCFHLGLSECNFHQRWWILCHEQFSRIVNCSSFQECNNFQPAHNASKCSWRCHFEVHLQLIILIGRDASPRQVTLYVIKWVSDGAPYKKLWERFCSLCRKKMTRERLYDCYLRKWINV